MELEKHITDKRQDRLYALRRLLSAGLGTSEEKYYELGRFVVQSSCYLQKCHKSNANEPATDKRDAE